MYVHKLLNSTMLARVRKLFSRKLDVLVIVGPSGVGKGTLIRKLNEDYPDSFSFSVSHTTRSPRSNEVDGVHYHFTTKEQFLKDKENGCFLETAMVHNNIYGTSKSAVDDVINQGKICILDIDLQGAQSVYNLGLRHKVKFMYIKPPNLDDLRARLAERNTEKKEEVEKRMLNSAKEIEALNNQLRHMFDCIIINQELNQCYKDILVYLEQWNAKLKK